MDLGRLHVAQQTKLISDSGVWHAVAAYDGVREVQDLTSVTGVC